MIIDQQGLQDLHYFYKRTVITEKDFSTGQCTVGGIAHISFKHWFQITVDAHPWVSGPEIL